MVSSLMVYRESLIAAKMAKELLWERESKLAPEEVVKVQQT